MKTERFNENYTIVMYTFYSIFSHLWWALLHFSLWVPKAPFCQIGGGQVIDFPKRSITCPL